MLQPSPQNLAYKKSSLKTAGEDSSSFLSTACPSSKIIDTRLYSCFDLNATGYILFFSIFKNVYFAFVGLGEESLQTPFLRSPLSS